MAVQGNTKQLTLGGGVGAKYAKPTRREQFLADMDRVVPWRKLRKVIEPVYSGSGGGRPAKELELMLRIYLLQQWFNLSDPGVEEAVYDSRAMQRFLGIDLGQTPEKWANRRCCASVIYWKPMNLASACFKR